MWRQDIWLKCSGRGVIGRSGGWSLLLLCYEVASALYRSTVHEPLSLAEAETLLDLTLRQDIELMTDSKLHRRAMQVAGVLAASPTIWRWQSD